MFLRSRPKQLLSLKYDRVAAKEQRHELYGADGGYDLLLVAFGTMARICKTAIHELEQEGLKVALFRPITLNPFPYAACREAMDALPADGRVLDIEMNMGQMLYDVRPPLTEGEMSKVRAYLVKEESLESIAQTFRLGRYLPMYSG